MKTHDDMFPNFYDLNKKGNENRHFCHHTISNHYYNETSSVTVSKIQTSKSELIAKTVNGYNV